MPRLPNLLLALGLTAAWVCTVTVALAAPPPPPPPPPPPQLPVSALVAPPGTCEKLGPCDLYSQLQEHSRRIAGFSYNVKKADAALTALARQQAAAAVRTDRLAHALTQLEISLDGLSPAPAATVSTTLASGVLPAPPVTATTTPATPAAPAPVPAGDWEQAASRELARLGDRLTRLREQVNTTFVRTLRENSEELATLRGRVASLNAQVADLAAAARGETAGRRVVATPGESQSFTATHASASQSPSPFPFNSTTTSSTTEYPHTTTTAVLQSLTTTTATTSATEAHHHETASSMAAAPNATQEVMVVVPTVASELDASVTTNAATSADLASLGIGGTTEQTNGEERNVVTDTSPSADPPIGVTSTQGEGEVNVNGNGNGNGNGESVDSLGIELETVRTAFDTLHAQVTDLQARCNSRGDELEAMVATLEQRLAGLELSKISPPHNSTSSDLNVNATINNNNTEGSRDATTHDVNVEHTPGQQQAKVVTVETAPEQSTNVTDEVRIQIPQVAKQVDGNYTGNGIGLTEIIRGDVGDVRTDVPVSPTVLPTSALEETDHEK